MVQIAVSTGGKATHVTSMTLILKRGGAYVLGLFLFKNTNPLNQGRQLT